MTSAEISNILSFTKGDVEQASKLFRDFNIKAPLAGPPKKKIRTPTGSASSDSSKEPFNRDNDTILGILMGEKNLTGIKGKARSLTNLIIEKSVLEKLEPFGLKPGTLPSQIGYFKSLTKFKCNENELSELPKEIGQLKELQKLFCSQNQLTSLPTEIGQLSQLQELWCDLNKLTSLPAEIGQLTNLKIFNCQENKLRSLPPELGQLKELRKFWCSDNLLTSLPVEIGQLKQIQEFDCSKNLLNELPAEIGQLSELRELLCDDNQLRWLPPEIGDLSQLRFLSCSDNNLTFLPAEIGNLSELEYLDCTKNALESLPEEIGWLGKLEDLLSDSYVLYSFRESQNRKKVLQKTVNIAENKETMSEFMNGVELKQFVLSLKGSNMFLIHFDRQAREEQTSYYKRVLDFLENSGLIYRTVIRNYLISQDDPHLLALVSVNNNSLLLNGFLLGTFSSKDFDYTKQVIKAQQMDLYAEISYLSTAKPPEEFSENYFSNNETYYFGTMLVKIFESMALKAKKKFLILDSVTTALNFYIKLGFQDTNYDSPDDDVHILRKEASVPLDSNAEAPNWHQVLEARREKMMADAIVLSRGNLVAAAQLVWHRVY